MYGGQGNYTSQFRQGPPGPPPPYQQPLPGPPPFMQAPPGPSLPPAPHGPQVRPLGQQPPPFFSLLAAPLAQQPVHFPPPPPTNSSHYSQQLPLPPAPPPPHLQANGSAPVVPPYPSAGFSVPLQMPNSNAHFGMQPPPPPRILPPPPQPISQPQGQVLYHNPHPPNPGMLHAPPHPPWPSTGPIIHPPHPPPSFDLKIPAPFTGKPSARDVHPPSIPPPPSPLPPPPPSSPPPLPPSPPAPIPASEDFPMDSLEVFTPNSKIDLPEFDDAQVHPGDASIGLIDGNKVPMIDEEASGNRALSPPRPDESVVRNMEVLCQFIVKVGPDFENTARQKEAGNPKFDFLFGGKPGSAAAIGHEYFQWMKKKYVAERKPPKGLKQNALSIGTLTADISSQPGNVERLVGAHSPATSDMDMEDDISPADIGKGFSNTNKESSVSGNARSYSFENEKGQLRDDIHLANGASSPITSIDEEDEKESSVFEDVSPNRGSPDSVGLGDRTHAPSILTSRDSIIAKASPNNENAKSQAPLGVYLKYGSPFRLIQDYASDESDDENVRSGNDAISNPVSFPATTIGTSSLQQKKQSESCSKFGGQDISTAGNGSEYCSTTGQFSPSRLQGAVRSPDKTVPSTINFDTIYKDVDPDIHQVGQTLNDRSETSRPPSEYSVPEKRKMDTDQETEKFYSKENLTEKNNSHNVDEFGRLVRKSGSGSDSEGSQYIERHANRGMSRSQSQSLSRSPQGSRWRRRSRSPRKRDRRSHSRSWSPKRGRSRSPQSFRSNISARRGRNLPPDCFNFIRGRCFYGASCRFLHRDSGRMNMQQRYQDSRKPRYLDKFDDLSFSKSIHHDKTGVTELHTAKRNKLVEADNIITQTVFGKFLDGKDGPIPAPEAEDASNLGSQGMTPEAEDNNNLVSRDMTPEAEDTNDLVFREMTTEAEDTNKLVFREMTPEAEDTNNLAFREMTPKAEDTNNLVSREMTPEAEDGSNLVTLEMIPEADDDSSPVSSKIIRPELESPVEEVPFTSVNGGITQPMSEASEPLLADSFLVQSPARKSEPSQHHTVFEQPSSADAFSSQLSPSNTLAITSYAEKSSQHALLVQTSQSTTVPVQASTSQINVGKNVASEETANQIITAHSYSQNVSSIEPSVQPLQEEFSSNNLLMSGSNFSSPPPLSLPPPPHGKHARPFLPPPPPQHMQHSMHILSDSSNGLFSSQQFREDIVLPMTSYQSQPLPPPYMLYPQRSPLPPLPSNLQSNQPNFPWSDQHMLPLHSRPPFPSSETSQLRHLHNSNPPRNDFMPLARPYPPCEVLGSRPSDFYSQAFLSVPSVHPPRHQSFPNEQGGVHLQNQGLPLLRSVQGDRLDLRSYPGDEFSASHSRDINQPLYIQQNSASSAGTMNPSLQRYTENNFQLQPSDVGVPRFPIKEHYNPYASTFEQPLRGGPSLPGPQIKRYDSSLSADNVPIIGIGFEMRSSPRSSMRLGEQVLPRTGNYIHESSAERIQDIKKQLVQEPVAGAQYDPLFDSIEPSPDASKIRVEEQNSGVNDTGSASKRRATKVGSKKNKGGLVTEPKAEADELGEVATDADAGGVENESPQLLDDKNWSPLLPFDVGETNVGEIEINQVRSPSKSKRIRDSKSMKFFKAAIADFAKEVLKPSWRQGNLSKEAFKTIVKKTVDKVAGAVPSYQVPKSQAKINQYMESSQRKLTKLVLGYVDKYVKM